VLGHMAVYCFVSSLHWYSELLFPLVLLCYASIPLYSEEYILKLWWIVKS
jgi:hypothetical protein